MKNVNLYKDKPHPGNMSKSQQIESGTNPPLQDTPASQVSRDWAARTLYTLKLQNSAKLLQLADYWNAVT